MNKKIFLFPLTLFTVNACGMLKLYPDPTPAKLKYNPRMQQENTHSSTIRCFLDDFCTAHGILPSLDKDKAKSLQLSCTHMEKKLIENGDIYTIKYAIHEEKECDCALYALAKTIGFKSNLIAQVGSSTSISVNIFKYFKQTNNPQKNDLVIYSNTKEVSGKTHTGIVIDHDTFESKWGISPCIMVHPLFHVPEVYGNYAYFFTLRNRFRTLPKELLINLMHHDTIIIHGNTNAAWRSCLLKYYYLLGRLDPAGAIHFLSKISE